MARTLSLCLITGVLFASSGLSHAQEVAEEDPFFTISGNFALVSDYRFRGVSLSDEDIAPQGGFTINTAPGFFIGAWASSIESFNGAEAEVDLVAGYGRTFGDYTVTVGVTAYTYPGGRDTNYVEPYATVGATFGPLSTSVTAAYAPDQKNIGDTDNIYIVNNSSLALGDTPFTLNGSIGWEDGAFGNDRVSWTLGVSAVWQGLNFSATYVDTSQNSQNTDATVVFGIGVSF